MWSLETDKPLLHFADRLAESARSRLIRVARWKRKAARAKSRALAQPQPLDHVSTECY